MSKLGEMSEKGFSACIWQDLRNIMLVFWHQFCCYNNKYNTVFTTSSTNINTKHYKSVFVTLLKVCLQFSFDSLTLSHAWLQTLAGYLN